MNPDPQMQSQHSPASLSAERDFRKRGLNTSRLDTFMDATFAFVLTLLVISFDELPKNYDEMILAVKRIPAFLFSFTVLMSFWLGHRHWSRRYGLETGYTVFLSLALMFVVLVYVYPLRIMFESMFAALSNGYFTAEFNIKSRADLSGMFLYYSSGSCIMALIFTELYRTALRRKNDLQLTGFEIRDTWRAISAWAVVMFYSFSSLLLVIFLPAYLVALAGYVYFLIYPTIFVIHRLFWREKVS